MVVDLHIPKLKNYEKRIDSIQIYLDFNKDDELFYTNIFIREDNIVIKIPLMQVEELMKDLKFEKFCLNNCIFLTSI